MEKIIHDGKIISQKKLHYIGVADIKELLKYEFRFYIANPGHPLQVLDKDQVFAQWNIIKTHIAEPGQILCDQTPEQRKATKPRKGEIDRRIRLEDFESEYFYWVSEWESSDLKKVILLEKQH